MSWKGAEVMGTWGTAMGICSPKGTPGDSGYTEGLRWGPKACYIHAKGTPGDLGTWKG